MGFFDGGDSTSQTTNYTDSSNKDLRTVGDGGAFVVGQGATFTGVDPVTLQAMNGQQSDALKYMTSLGTATINRLGDSVTNVLDRSGANMATAWSHQVDVMGGAIETMTAASKANADAGQVVATAALNANANAGATLSTVFKWGAIAVAAYLAVKSMKA
jgi:hypothetical protein